MSFSFGTPAASNNTTQQQSAPLFSFGSASTNQPGNAFGAQQSNANPAPSFNLGNSNNQRQGQEQSKPSLSFGSNNNSGTPSNPSSFSFGGATNNSTQSNTNGGGLFGQSSQGNTGGLFGQSNSNQQQQTTGLFGQSSQPTQQSTTSGLFGQANPNAQPSAGLFGFSANQNTAPTSSSGLFGNNGQQNTSQMSNMFGQQAGQQPQQSLGGLFGSTSQPNLNMSSNAFNPINSTQQQQQYQQQLQADQQQLKAQPTLAQSVYGQTLSQPQFSWSRSAQQVVQPTMPSFNTTSSTLAAMTNTIPTNMNFGQSVPVTQNPYGPSEPASIQDQLLRLKNAWDPTHLDCMFQAYFYNRVAPETASLYTKPVDHKQSAWDEAVATRPDNSVIPVLARGFSDLQARLDAQQQQINAYRTRMHEIADKLKELDDRHLLHATPKIDAARRNHMQLTRRSLQLATKVQVLKCRGYALRPEEEQLRERLRSLEAQLRDPNTFGRIDEIWAKMTLLRQKKKAAEEDIKARGYISYINFDEGNGIESIGQVLRDFNNGLQHVSGILKSDLNKVEAEIEKYKTAQAGLDKSRARQ